MSKELISTAALGFGSGFGVGFVSSLLGQLYDKNPLPTLAEREHIHQRLEVVALATGLVGGVVFATSKPGPNRTFAAALIATSTFSIGVMLHGSLTTTPAPIEPEGP